LLFYKVVVFLNKKGLFSTGFLMSHEERMKKDKMFFVPANRGLELIRKDITTDFEDFPYKKVFQVSMEYLEEKTGLIFNWKGVKRIPVPTDKNQILKIRKIIDSADAAKAEKELRKGLIPEMRSIKVEEHITPAEEKHKQFKLNIILP